MTQPEFEKLLAEVLQSRALDELHTIDSRFTTAEYIEAIAETTVSSLRIPVALARKQLANHPRVVRTTREDLWRLVAE